MIDTHKMVEPLILNQDGDEDMTPTEHSFAQYDDDNSWVCKECLRLHRTPPAEDGMLHCDCGAVCQIAPEVSDYYVHGGEYADFWCPICGNFDSSVINDAHQVQCERCDIWLDLSR